MSSATWDMRETRWFTSLSCKNLRDCVVKLSGAHAPAVVQVPEVLCGIRELTTISTSHPVI